MAKATLPVGVAPAAPPVTLTSHRSVRRRYDLVGSDGGIIGPMIGARGASITQSAQARLKRGGQLSWTDRGEGVDWLTARIRASYEIDGYGAWGLGVYLPSKPADAWAGSVRRADVQMLDVATVLDEATVESGYALSAGANVTDGIKALIAYAGESAAAVTDSDKSLTAARVWGPGTSILSIINELGDAIGYFALASDGDGHLAVEPYVRPASRPIAWAFEDGSSAIYRDSWTAEQDLYEVPNHVIAVTGGTGDDPGLYSNVFNDDPDSPFSRIVRGRTVTRRVEADATDQAALDTIARRALIDATTPTLTVTIDALPLPIEVNNAVRFRSAPAGIDGRFVVTNIDLGEADTDLATYTLREVVDL